MPCEFNGQNEKAMYDNAVHSITLSFSCALVKFYISLSGVKLDFYILHSSFLSLDYIFPMCLG